MDDRLRQFQMKFQQGMGSRGPNYPGGFVDLTLRLGLPYNSDANLMTQIGHSDQLVANRPPQVQATPFNYFDASRDQGMQYGCVNMNNASDNYAGPINYLEKYNRIGIFVGQKSDGTSSEGVSESILSAPNSYGTNPYKTMAFSSAPQIKDYVLPNPSTTYNSTTGAQKGVGGSNTSRKNKKKNVTASENDQDDKRCSNLNCGTNSTPMWRKGPLGPKSLCNACGIKYRKQEEKRAAMEAAEEANY